jgi:hypothetical protein
MKATTFGVHAQGQDWQFFTLSYMKLGAKTYLHGGVTRRL